MILEIEQALLSCLLNYPKSCPKVMADLNAQDFSDPLHQIIFQSMADMVKAGREPSILLMPEALKGENERKYIASLLSSLVSAVSINDYVYEIKNQSLKRSLSGIAQKLTETAQGEAEATEVASEAINSISSCMAKNHGLASIGEIMELIDLDGVKDLPPCWPTGMPRFDKALDGGFYGGRMYGIAARQKKGKTAMMGTFAYNCAQNGARVAYLTLEMDRVEIAQRLLSREANVRPSVFRNVNNLAMSAPKLRKAREILGQKKISIISAPRLSLEKLRLTLSSIGYSKSTDIVVIDYLQLVSGQGKGQTSADHLDNVAQTMAEMCKTHGYTIITAVQLNRDDAVRGGDGLLNACDMALKLDTSTYNRADGTEGVEAWLEMLATRYTPYANIGAETAPAFDLIDEGPYYDERS